MRIRHRRTLAALAALFSLTAHAAPAGAQQGPPPTIGPDGHQHDTVTAACGAPAGSTCYVSILRARGGVVSLKLMGQTKQAVSDVEVGKDYYVIMVDAKPPNSLSACRASTYDSNPCYWGLLTASIGDYRVGR